MFKSTKIGRLQWVLAITLVLAAMASPLKAEEKTGYWVKVQDRLETDGYKKAHIYHASEPYMTVDVTSFTQPSEILWYGGGPASPDGKHMALMTWEASGGGRENSGLVLVDLPGRKIIYRRLLYNTPLTPPTIYWLSNRKVVFAKGILCIYDMDADTVETIEGDFHPRAWDRAARNRASLFGHHQGLRARKIEDLPPEILDTSHALRYNGYWVYPLPIRGWDNPQEYRTWTQTRTVGLGKQPMEEPMIRNYGVALPRMHIFSRPVFVSDTTWVAVYEQVFERNTVDKLLESNFVLIDAHEVKENPPDPQHIHVRSIPAPVFAPRNVAEFSDLRTALELGWDDDRRVLELVKQEIVDYDFRHSGIESRQKIAEVPIDLSSMTFGEPRLIVPISGIPWSSFVNRASE